jgi:hypothetical protein
MLTIAGGILIAVAVIVGVIVLISVVGSLVNSRGAWSGQAVLHCETITRPPPRRDVAAAGIPRKPP